MFLCSLKFLWATGSVPPAADGEVSPSWLNGKNDNSTSLSDAMFSWLCLYSCGILALGERNPRVHPLGPERLEGTGRMPFQVHPGAHLRKAP